MNIVSSYILSLSFSPDMAHPRPIDKEFEDADDTGVLVISGRNLRQFPNVPGDLLDYGDVFEAGWSLSLMV